MGTGGRWVISNMGGKIDAKIGASSGTERGLTSLLKAASCYFFPLTGLIVLLE